MEERAYWVGFSRVSGIGPVKVRALLNYFGSLEKAWAASPGQLKIAGLDDRALANLLKARKELSLERELEKIEKAGVRFLTWEDDEYPYRLRQIPDPPPVLYFKGELKPEDEIAVAVVGTRRASSYGLEAARKLAYGLAKNGVTIVSGLALGIDGAAHQAAIEAGGRTIAVLGSGLDYIYPSSHRKLATQIVSGHGALVSEYPLGTRPEARNFPPRNRIISGLSMGVLVVEAGVKSGALITARYAADQGRDVFAVPGSMFKQGSKGTNRLIQDGAKLVLDLEDILEELDIAIKFQHVEAKKELPTDPTEAKLLALLSEEPTHVDEICRASGLPASTVTSTLALMELKGLVRSVGFMQYVRA